jgi:hypothetical protein
MKFHKTLAVATLTVALAAAPAAAVAVGVADWEMNDPAGSTVMHDSGPNHLDGVVAADAASVGLTRNGSYYHWQHRAPNAAPAVPSRVVSVRDSPLLDLTNATQTYTLAVRYRTTENFGNVTQKGQSASPGGQIKIQQPQGKPSCLFKGSIGRVTARTATPVNDGAWHTVTCVRSQFKVQEFVDGVLKSTKNGQTGTIDNKVALTIGGKLNCDQVNTTCDYFSGDIDWVKVSKG